MSEMGLKNGMFAPFLDPAVFLMWVVFIVWLVILESLAPWDLHLLQMFALLLCHPSVTF